MKPIRYVAVALLASGIVMYVGTTSAKRKGNTKLHPFTLTSATFRITNNGAPVLEHVTTKFVRSSSNWKELRTDIKTQTVRTQIAKDDSVYQLDSGKKEWKSKAAQDDWTWTAEALRSHPQLVETEELFGLTTYKLRTTIGQDGWADFSYAVETGKIPLKIHITYKNRGDQEIVEPMSLTFGEIPDSVFNGPDMPVSFDRIQKLVQSAEEQGQHEYAEALRRSINEAQQKRN